VARLGRVIHPCYPGNGARSAGLPLMPKIPAEGPQARAKVKWRLLLPGASEPRQMELNPSGLQTWFFKPLTRPEQPEHSCRLQLLHSPMTAEPYREKTRRLRPRRSCFAPTETRAMRRAWVEAPGAAPGSEWFIAAAIYFHSRQAGRLNIERFPAKWRPVGVEKDASKSKSGPMIEKNRPKPARNQPQSRPGTRRIGLALPRLAF
jgi:hypothetical protein